MADFDFERLRELKRQQIVVGLELVERRKKDPLRNFALHKKQEAFVDAVLRGGSTPEMPSENWFLAANRAGKSDAGAFLGSRFARFGMPDWEKNKKIGIYEGGRLQVSDRATSGWVVAVDFPSSRDVIQPKYFDNGYAAKGTSHEPFIPAHEYDAKNGWNSTNQILKLKNGSIIGFKSCDSGPKKFQGADKDWIHFDEEPDRPVYRESSIRVSGRKLHIYGTCTILPEEGRSAGISWLYEEIVTPWKKGNKSIGVYNASIYDNPYLDPAEVRKLEDKYPEGSIERRIRLDGELLPGLLGARAYVSFNYQLHIRRQPEINPRRPLLWTHDFNVSPLCSLLVQKEGSLFRVYREIIVDGEGLDGVLDRFYQIVPRHQSEIWIYGDSTGKRRSGQTGKSDYYILLNGLRQYGSPVRLKVPDENPRVPDRVNAMNMALRDRDGISYIEVDESCDELIADFEQVLRSNNGGIKKIDDPSNPYYKRTHASDAFGYLIAYERPVRMESLGQSGQKQVAKVQSPSYQMSRTRV